ncbi:hypothetical protein L208DRAFT_1069844, partial [Tricholoma matsutake]
VFEEGATAHGCMKTVGQDIIQIFYNDDLYPQLDFNHNSDQLLQITSRSFSKTPGRTNNFLHPAVIELCKRFYYSGN